MRVLHLLHSVGCGGLERVVASVANGLARRGMPQAVCCLHNAEPIAQRLDADVELILLNARANDPTLPFKLRRVFRSFGPDVIDTADFSSWPDATLAALTCPRIARMHVFHGFLARPPRRWRLAGRLLARWTHRLRAVSSDLADRAAEVFGLRRERIEVVPNGVDVDHFDRAAVPRPHPRPAGSSGQFTCVTVASLSPAKNPLLLVEVAQRVRPDVHFVWVGDGPLRAEFARRIAQQGLTDSFTLTGTLEDVRPELAGADAFVLPSVTEAAPLCVLEAMAMQLPVIATRAGDLGSIIGSSEAGILVDTGDAGGTAAAIAQLLDDTDGRRTMGACGRAAAVERFSLHGMLDRYQQGYEELCVRTRR